MRWSSIIADGGVSWRSNCLFDPVTLTVATLAGAAISGGGTILGGQAQAQQIQAGAEFTAAQERAAAAESRAVGQRQAFEKQRNTQLALSALRARSAASGGAGSMDEMKLGSDIAGRGEYQALTDLYTGENRARGLEDSATAELASASAKAQGLRTGSLFSGVGTILSGVGSFGAQRARIDYAGSGMRSGYG